MSAKHRNALGRGLSALLENNGTDITGAETKPLHSISEIPISQVQANPFQPREEFDEVALLELAESIKVHGIIQPITVRKLGYDSYQIISGERRTRASRLAGLTNIPAFIRLADDQGMLEMALIENIQREELNAMEIAYSYKRLVDECNLNQDQLGERVGKNRSTVNNYMRLLKLPDNIQAALRDAQISMGHARAIINIDNSDEQQYLFSKMVEDGLSVREVENLVRAAHERKDEEIKATPEAKKKAELPVTFVEFQKSLSSKFETKVKIKADERGRGIVSIPFKSQQDLKRIMELL
ncbi:MAG: ParB/RepB/Spo0J family partition protein [Bacteroidia bacterium]|jgi:ParB family transcriptional regulator, chromosome partitioning protein|nr:ParB/RepB/Spo0J family partition protein [Bacteroidia bacterium]MCF8427496.1 ParB/RepB/Spo0J family partition protein [Bacteroidia bacterium]MCF8447749.1 ParB/RepB/Spo0J family partition protein [Bacteroidia bacterium]